MYIYDLISIVVPIYNKEKFILDTINTIKNQTYTNWEVIFVNDCSNDKSVDYIKKNWDNRFHVEYLNENCGAANARNIGVKYARGQYICFLDADDLWNVDKLEKQIHFMKENQYAFTFTDYEYSDINGKGTGKCSRVPYIITYKEALKNTTIFTSTVMIDTSKIKKDDIFMKSIPYEDTATWWQILKKHKEGYGLQEVLTLYRRGSKTLSSNKLIALKRAWNLYRNVEGFSNTISMYYFVHYLFNAIKRRI